MTFFLEYSLDDDKHHLMCSEHGFVANVGPRLFRAPPHPDIEFAYADEGQANTALKKMREYWEGLPKQKKKKVQAKGAFE